MGTLHDVIAKQRLKELATLRPEGHKVLSLYLNLDPSEFPTPRARQAEIDSLLDSADKTLRTDGVNHDQKEALKGDIQRLRDWYANDFDASGAHGMAVFVAGGIDLFEVHKLGRPITSEIVIDDSPFIEPLTTMPGEDGYCALLVDRQVARILTGGSAGFRELSTIVDDLDKWESSAGPRDRGSQDGFQRAIAKEAKDHLKRAADELFKLFKQGQVQRLIVGSQQEIKNEVEGTLHSYLRDRIAGWIDVDVRCTPRELTASAESVIVADEQQVERQWLERLQSEVGRNARGAAGLADTLAALNERRVEALLVREGFRAPGFATPNADYLATEAGDSPSGEAAAARDDVIESALESALEQSAEIVVIRHDAEQLEALGSIGAVLRF